MRLISIYEINRKRWSGPRGGWCYSYPAAAAAAAAAAGAPRHMFEGGETDGIIVIYLCTCCVVFSMMLCRDPLNPKP